MSANCNLLYARRKLLITKQRKDVKCMARPTPRKFTTEELKSFSEQSAKQTSKSRNPLTTDENKYPMFDIPVNDKVVVYVPNYTEITEDENGEPYVHVRWDKGAFHNIRFRGSYARYRCTEGIAGIEGFDGSCPFCEVGAENWELYNIEYADACKKKGQDPDTEEGKKAMEAERKQLLSNMAVSGKQIYMTFPIVVVECKEGTTTPKFTDDGEFIGKLYWYTISESTYTNKWAKTFNVYPEGKQHPAGRWLVLDYTYDAKNGKPTKMQSANNLSVNVLPIMQDDNEEWNNKVKEAQVRFDEMAKDWDANLAREVIYNNQVYDVDSLTPIANEVMQPTRDKLQVYQSRGLTGGSPDDAPALEDSNSPESLAASFGGVPEGGMGVDE